MKSIASEVRQIILESKRKTLMDGLTSIMTGREEKYNPEIQDPG